MHFSLYVLYNCYAKMSNHYANYCGTPSDLRKTLGKPWLDTWHTKYNENVYNAAGLFSIMSKLCNLRSRAFRLLFNIEQYNRAYRKYWIILEGVFVCRSVSTSTVGVPLTNRQVSNSIKRRISNTCRHIGYICWSSKFVYTYWKHWKLGWRSGG